jgi:thioredoxin reductase
VVRLRTDVVDGYGDGWLDGVTDVEWACDREPLPLETSMPGAFAAGDVRQGAVNRVASAVGEGATVVRLLHEYLREGVPAQLA